MKNLLFASASAFILAVCFTPLAHAEGIGAGVHVGPLGIGVGVGNSEQRERSEHRFHRGQRFNTLPLGIVIGNGNPCWQRTESDADMDRTAQWTYTCD